MHRPLRTFAAVALGATLLGGCAAIDSLLGRDGAPDADDAPGTPAPTAATPAEEAVVDDPAADIPIARPGRPLMREVQAALNERGLDAGPPDGLSGPRTVRAIRLFKVARRMEVTDDVTPRLLDELELTQP